MKHTPPSELNLDNDAHAHDKLRHVFIRDLRLKASVGLHPHEKTTPQMILINIDVAIAEPAETPTKIDDVVCYEQLVTQIRETLAHGHIELVETLAEQIAARLMHDKRIVKLRLRIEKPDAIKQAAGAGIEIERIQNL